MMPETYEQRIERLAKAMKAEIRRQFGGVALLGDKASDDWYSDGGSLDLEDLARALIASDAAAGVVAVPREATEEMIEAALTVHWRDVKWRNFEQMDQMREKKRMAPVVNAALAASPFATEPAHG